ncbi:alpha-taxilin isoform X1 [Tachysurus vachellii]|uniref:alpha-taxilin isoform X1 n=1 Tax=Tachysurus vachellii TaxID=175792 RepID=UPI00296A9905|nr:alpha-taxilin isoform X1 [Tachysurus vachellii]
MESSSQASDSGEKVNSVEEKPVNPMEVFSKQLEDIINTFGSASSLLEEKISSLEKDEENLEEETTDANKVVSSNPETEQTASGLLEGLSKEASPLLQSLKTLMSPEEKVEMVLSKYGELLKEQKSEQVQLKMLQKRQGLLVKQRDHLQLEHSRGILARSRLEILCRDLYEHTKTLKEEMLLKCQEDERKRAEIHSQFQCTVLDIQAQIEQHSNCNNKLSQENSDLASKLNSILHKYERREETLEKIFRQRDLQQELSDAKLEEANLRLKEAEEKHRREKEYLLKEAIDKTKKCFTMKEQELQMKKQLVLYSQKFDEFQATLAKSNDVYAVFKQDMENMTKKMAKLEKEGNMWKIRFENCNKALTEMINERSEKGKEMALFTVKIDKLQTLCRALQEERKILYDKIKEIRLQATSASASIADITEEEIPELAQLSVLEPERNPALTAEMEKLWKEQARLKEFADLLMASTSKDMDSSNSDEELSEPKQTAQLTPLVPVPSKAVQSNQQEEEPTKSEPPKEEPPKAEQPKVEPPKEEPPKAEPPKEDPPKAEPPKEEPPKVEPPKAEPPKAEPPKEEPPKVEPPKAEPPKAEPPNVEPPKAEPPNVEPPKAEPPKAEPPKEEPPKAEPPKEEPPKAEPPKEEPPKAEPPKEEPPKAEPPKKEPPKAEPPKEEPPKAEPPKVKLPKAEPPNAESHKEKFAKVPKKNVAKVEPIQQNTHPQKSNKPNSVEQKEPQPKEVKTVRAQAEAPQVNSSKNEHHPEQDPKTESTKEALVAEAEPIKSEPPEASTAGAAKPQNCKCSESKASANKAHSKKPSSSKKKAAAKATKKS